jgi:hypothetical protein
MILILLGMIIILYIFKFLFKCTIFLEFIHLEMHSEVCNGEMTVGICFKVRQQEQMIYNTYIDK